MKTTILLMLVLAMVTPAGAADEEFVGPFPSWRDARRDYGARGDGQADDTAALQRALDELTKHTNWEIGDHPDPAKSATGAGSLDNRGTVGDATLLRHLAPLRTARVWLPDRSVPPQCHGPAHPSRHGGRRARRNHRVSRPPLTRTFVLPVKTFGQTVSPLVDALHRIEQRPIRFVAIAHHAFVRIAVRGVHLLMKFQMRT